MAKIELGIDFDVDYHVMATVEILGLRVTVELRRKKTVGKEVPKLPDPGIIDLAAEDYSDLSEDEASEAAEQ